MGEPAIYLFLQDLQRHAAARQDLIVEGLDVKAGAGISNGFFDGFADDRLFVGTMIETTEQPFTHSITNGEADFQSPAFRVDFPAIFERYPDGLQVSIRVVDTNPGGVVASRRIDRRSCS